VADERAALAEGLDPPRRGGRSSGGGRTQVPLAAVRDDPEHLAIPSRWLRSYRPEELFDEYGRPAPDLLESPPGRAGWAAIRTPNGQLLRPLRLPDFPDFAA
jgi:xylulose-5-phosphate/fructose-6-phosphate phosphoketolase